MPLRFDRIYLESDHGLAVTARALPGSDRRAYLGLAGEIDATSSAVLGKTVDWLTALAPSSVLMDLAELTFACSTLPNFVARVRNSVPAGAELILWRAGPLTQRVLRLTAMEIIATIREEPELVAV